MLKHITLLLLFFLGLSMPVFAYPATFNGELSIYEERITSNNLFMKRAKSGYHGIGYIDNVEHAVNFMILGIAAYYTPPSEEPLAYVIDIGTSNNLQGLPNDIKEIEFFNSERHTHAFCIRGKKENADMRIYNITLEIKHTKGALKLFFASEAQPAIMRITFIDNSYLDYYLRTDTIEHVRKVLNIT